VGVTSRFGAGSGGDGMKTLIIALALCGAAVLALEAQATTDEVARDARWQELKEVIFEGRPVQDGSGLVVLEAPARALDAALVPVTIRMTDAAGVTGVYLVIDENPAPLAAHIAFGPGADPRAVSLRVRVNQYTRMHAVAETADGQLHETMVFVKAAGGCSAPVGADEAASLAEIGRMKLRLGSEFAPGAPVEAQLMIRHPNFSGMQMDQLTRMYTPMRFVQTVDIAYDGTPVLHVDGDISLSTDPVIGFAFTPKGPGEMTVVVRDSDGAVFEDSFPLPPSGS